MRRRDIVVLAVLGALTVVAYAPALRGAFVYDDNYFVVDNDAIKLPTRAWEWVSTAEAASEGKRWGTIFRPVRTLSYGADYAAWRLNPVGFHLTSLLLHLVAVCAVWALARRLTGAGIGALCGAAVFALHPLPSEAVCWIGARADVLGAVAVLAFTLLALRPARAGPALAPDGLGRTLAGAALLLLAVAGKEAAAGVVPAVAAIRWLRDREAGAFGRAVRWAVVPAATVLAYAAGRTLLLGHASRYGYYVGNHIGWTWATVLQTRIWELGRVLVPTRLSVEYSALPVVRSLATGSFWLAVVAAIAIAWCAWRCRRAAPWVTAAIAWWVCFLLPVSQLIPLNALSADRWLHLPFAGLAVLIAAGVGRLERRPWPPAARWAAGAAAVGLCLAMAAGTYRRAGEYRDETTLWTASLERWPESEQAWHARANARVRDLDAVPRAERPARKVAIVADLDRATGSTYSEDMLFRIAWEYLSVGRPDRALAAVRRGLAIVPHSFPLQAVRAEALWAAGDRRAAEAAFDDVLSQPDATGAAVDRVRVAEVVYVAPPSWRHPPEGETVAAKALVWQRRAWLRKGAGDAAGALQALERGLAEWPESQMMPTYLAQVEKESGRMAAARARLDALVATRPEVEAPYLRGAEFALEDGDPGHAVAILVEAVNRWPFDAALWERLIEAAVAARDGAAAARYRSRLVDLGVPRRSQRAD